MQRPNIPLIGWFVFTATSLFVKSSALHSLFGYISFGFIFTWAWLEITTGTSYFRRALGAIILALTLFYHLK